MNIFSSTIWDPHFFVVKIDILRKDLWQLNTEKLENYDNN